MKNKASCNYFYVKQEAVNCKTVLNANAENLSLGDERRLYALLPFYDGHGREMVKRLIVNAIRQNSQNYSEQVRKWADNAVVAMFIYETDNVLSDYISDHLSEATIENVYFYVTQSKKFTPKEYITLKKAKRKIMK